MPNVDSAAGWCQSSISFTDWAHAEAIAATHLSRLMTDTEDAGLIDTWFFIRKAPHWRVRYRPAEGRDHDATAVIRAGLAALRAADRITGWADTIYEPETHAFGGPTAMHLAHDLFHHDSHHILRYLAAAHAPPSNDTTVGSGPSRPTDQRREVSLLLCGLLHRSAGQDWYEQGDIWTRIAEHRPLPTDGADALDRLQPALRRLMITDTVRHLSSTEDLAQILTWAEAFQQTGQALAGLAHTGHLTRGLRAVLTHHVLFHWNRLGLPAATQGVLAHTAAAVVFNPTTPAETHPTGR